MSKVISNGEGQPEQTAKILRLKFCILHFVFAKRGKKYCVFIRAHCTFVKREKTGVVKLLFR